MKALPAAVALAAVAVVPAPVRTVPDPWRAAQPPVQPQAQPVSGYPATTAYLVLDMQANICNAERRPHCVDAVAPVADFLARARRRHGRRLQRTATLTSLGEIAIE